MNIFKKKQETDSIQLGKYPVEVAKLGERCERNLAEFRRIG